LILWPEFVEEVPVGYKRALIDESTTVDVIGIELEYTMPVLQHRKSVLLQRNLEGRNPYDGGHQVHGIVGQGIKDVELKGVALMSVGSKTMAKEASRVVHLGSRDQWSGEYTVHKASTAERTEIGEHAKSRAASDIRASVSIRSNVEVDNR